MTPEDRMFRAIRDAMGWGGRGVELNEVANAWSMQEAREFLRFLQGYGFTVIETTASAPQALDVERLAEALYLLGIDDAEREQSTEIAESIAAEYDRLAVTDPLAEGAP